MFRSLFPRVFVQPSSVGIGTHPNLSARDEWQAGAVMSCQYFTTNARTDMTLMPRAIALDMGTEESSELKSPILELGTVEI
ncbi:hypothetical protein JJD41_08000 [Oxynema sp. CENA135]|uniref:hypothetical protein n=1 Tax=Oxynema sp. CENA135 TaxID=984206 RepID=UPI00190E52C3|nr:hypothetical protein [Oxynema sp. CENA135]MBK4729806.1 hypothetical protein [Oxynema sp. CENA135]